MTTKDESLLTLLKTWNSDFITYKGFRCLFNYYLSLTNNKLLSKNEQMIFIFLLKVMSKYFEAVFSFKVPHLYRYRMLQNHLKGKLKFCSKYLRLVN